MKRKTFYKIFAVLITATVFFAACTKEGSDVRLDPQLATTQVTAITSNGANVVGLVIAKGDGFAEKGVCFATTPTPTVANSKVVYTGEATTATFTVPLTGLTFATKYYARAYATNAAGTIYGDEFNFTTLPVTPTLTTAAITDIKGTTATGGGNITANGGANVTDRGVCFSTTANPTIADSKTSDGTGNGAFVSSLTKLAGLTTYHVRAYATNSAGTSYGNDVSFTTLNATPPLFMVGGAVPAGWGWSTINKMIFVSQGIHEAYLPFKADAFRFFTDSANWGSGHNYPYYVAAGYAIDPLLVNAQDGDLNFKYIGVDGAAYKITVDENSKKITMDAATLYMVGSAVPAGWAWDNPSALAVTGFNVFSATYAFTGGNAFRFFTVNGEWGSGHNYPYYKNAGYTIDPLLEDAKDGDNNFKFTGATGNWTITLDMGKKTITMKAAAKK